VTNEELLAEKKRRLDFTKAVYEACQGVEMTPVDMWEIGRKLGFDEPVTQRVFQYLSAEKLLRAFAAGGAIALTHRGVVEIESSLEKPDLPTDHFPPSNCIYVGEMHNSQIQQGTYSSTQVQTISPDQIRQLQEYIKEFRAMLPGLKVSEESKQEAKAELDTLDAQARSPKPKLGIVRASLGILKELILHTGGALGAHELLNHMPHF